jgi:hypothetical protein
MSSFWLQVNPLWNAQHNEEYHCINEAKLMMAAASVSVVQDFLALGLPLAVFWKLRLSKRKRVSLGVVFLIGFL